MIEKQKTTSYVRLKSKLFGIIERAKPGDVASRVFDVSIIILIVANVIAVILSSFDNLNRSTTIFLQYFEYFSVTVFTIEYLLRVFTANLLYPKSKMPHLKYIFSFMAIIDLLAIAPFYLPFLFKVDLRFLRMLRLFRLIRVFKLNRYNDAMTIIGRVLKNEKEKLISTIFVMTIMLVFASSIMYYVENSAQPDKFPNILASIWWAVATLTTVGYGDVYPVTALGKILSGIIAILGIGLVALPTGIISSGFITEINRKKSEVLVCPHCGKEIKEI